MLPQSGIFGYQCLSADTAKQYSCQINKKSKLVGFFYVQTNLKILSNIHYHVS